VRLAQLNPPNLAAYVPGYWARRASLYNAMFDAFGGLTLTGCYGLNAGEVDTYDGGSFRVYVGGGSFTDLSTYDAVAQVMDQRPLWASHRATNPKAYREVSTYLGPKAALLPKYAAVTPERWGGYCGFLLWAMQAPGEPVSLRHYESYKLLPTTPVFTGDLAAQAETASPGLSAKTLGDYASAEIAACDRIYDPTILAYWREGTLVDSGSPLQPYLLECDQNTPRSKWLDAKGKLQKAGITLKVLCVACQKPDGNTLIYACTPFALPLTCSVHLPDKGDYTLTIDRPDGNYFVVEHPPAVEWVLRKL